MDETQVPKKISPSKLMGTTSSALGQVGQGGISNVGKIAGKVRSNTVRISQNESDIKINVDKLMGVEDEQEQIQETIFNVVDKQGDTQAQVRENSDKIASGMETIAMNLNIIAKELAGTNDILLNQLKNQEKASSQLAQESLKEERDKKEKESESVVKKVSDNIVESVKKPFKSFFDRMVDFFKNIILGTAVLGILNWLKEPANQQRVENFANFIIDKMPLILTGIAAFLAIGLGVKLVGVISAIVQGIKGLTFILGLGGGVGLLAVLGAVAAFLAAKFIEDTVRPVVQDMFLGVGYTETGLMFRGEDIANLRDEQRKFLVQQGVSGESLDQQLKKYDDLLASMRARKSINDELAQVEQDIKRREEQIKRQRESGDTKSADKNQGILDNRIKRRAELKNNLEFANRQVTIGFSSLNVSESDLERDIVERGGTITRTPGAVSPDLRVDSGESDSEPMSFGKMGMESMESTNFTTDASIETPTFDISSTPSDTGEMTNLPETPKVPIEGIEMFRGMDKVKSDPAMFSGNKSMLYDIPSPELSNETIVLPPTMGGDKPGNEAAGYSSPGTNLPPIFSAFDANNPSLHAVMSVYNALA